MPAKKATSLTETEFFLMSIIKHNVPGSIKYDEVSTELGGDKTINALRKKYIKLREKADHGGGEAATGASEGAAEGVGEDDTDAAKPVKKQRATTAKKRKVEAVEEADDQDAGSE